MKYVSFLRGVNVGGHNAIKMPELKAMYQNIGLKNVSTFIQSGNILFESNSIEGLSEKIKEKIKKTFNLDIPVVIRNQKEIQYIISRNPFSEFENKNVHVLLLSDALKPGHHTALNSIFVGSDKFVLSGNEIFLYYPNGAGHTKLTATLFEKKTGFTGTARNMNTIEELKRILLT